MKIGILSQSVEIYSTKRLFDEAIARGHDCEVIDHTKCSLFMAKGEPFVIFQNEIVKKLDAIIPRIGASVTFYGTAVVRQFEMQKTFSTADSQAILRSRDKLRSFQVLSRAGIGFPKTVFAKFPKNDEVDNLIERVGGAPLIVKLLEGTQGMGVVLTDTHSSAKSMVEAFSGIKTNILIQEFIEESRGTDIRVIVIDGEIVGAMERKGKTGEFRSNLHRGGKAEVIKLKPREKTAAIKAAAAMGLPFAGVDMLRSNKGPLIIEVNSSPGLKGIEEATGVNVAGKLIEYIEKNSGKRQRVKTRG